MADNDGSEKSEEPTSRQFEKAREEGNVAKSKDLTSGIILTGLVLFLYMYMPIFVEDSKEMLAEFFQNPTYAINSESVVQLFYFSLQIMGKLLLPMFAFAFVLAFIAEVGQVGFNISTKALEPKWERLNPVEGMKKFFKGKRQAMELFKSLFKIFVLGAIGVYIVMGELDPIMRMTDAEYMDSTVFMAKLLFEILFKISLVVLVLGILDFAYQKWQHKQDLMMTKQQVKEEYKQMEGDPLVKQRIRTAQRDLARKRMMADVSKADVVITNPTHYAIALSYSPETNEAPTVLAKGQRLMALKIKDIAKENNIYIHEDKPLAQMLYKTVDIGDTIPENLFRAVAEILAIVYRMKNKTI